MQSVIETTYPIDFRHTEAEQLGTLLRNHDSIVLIGMKRVGISNFLRFFLNHDGITRTYIRNGSLHLFVPIDLNDLVERSLTPFWTLTLKRLVDAIEESSLPDEIKSQSLRYFTDSIQIRDKFYTFDSVQKVIKLIVMSGMYPSLFFIRFDRIRDVITHELFANLQGIRDCVKQNISFVFTSYRPLHELSPEVFPKSALSVFSQNMYLPPADPRDMTAILDTFKKRYQLMLSEKTCESLLSISGGHVQYLQLALINLLSKSSIPQTERELFLRLSTDEQIRLQSEELFDSLVNDEQSTLVSLHNGHNPDSAAREKTRYLWDTGVVKQHDGKISVFNMFFSSYLDQADMTGNDSVEFTKKEHALYRYLKNNEGILCEREDIIQHVWSETAVFGVTDWAIDRLVARVRIKLRKKHSSDKIITVVSRGYKLIRK